MIIPRAVYILNIYMHICMAWLTEFIQEETDLVGPLWGLGWWDASSKARNWHIVFLGWLGCKKDRNRINLWFPRWLGCKKLHPRQESTTFDFLDGLGVRNYIQDRNRIHLRFPRWLGTKMGSKKASFTAA